MRIFTISLVCIAFPPVFACANVFLASNPIIAQLTQICEIRPLNLITTPSLTTNTHSHTHTHTHTHTYTFLDPGNIGLHHTIIAAPNIEGPPQASVRNYAIKELLQVLFTMRTTDARHGEHRFTLLDWCQPSVLYSSTSLILLSNLCNMLQKIIKVFISQHSTEVRSTTPPVWESSWLPR